MIRITAATRLVLGSFDIEVLNSCLFHGGKDVRTTMIYKRIEPWRAWRSQPCRRSEER